MKSRLVHIRDIIFSTVTLYLNLCNCLFLVCLIYQLKQVKRWTRKSYKFWLLSWLKISKRRKI
ncbi:hypothetical protein D3790_06585 [Xenorhabdus nematophila]|nr:hypothetical protein D3790_06585 [Xenorhabdus nematophila]